MERLNPNIKTKVISYKNWSDYLNLVNLYLEAPEQDENGIYYIKHCLKTINGSYTEYISSYKKYEDKEEFSIQKQVYIKVYETELNKMFEAQNKEFDRIVDKVIFFELLRYFNGNYNDYEIKLNRSIKSYKDRYTTNQKTTPIQIHNQLQNHSLDKYYVAFNKVNNNYNKRGNLAKMFPNKGSINDPYCHSIAFHSIAEILRKQLELYSSYPEGYSKSFKVLQLSELSFSSYIDLLKKQAELIQKEYANSNMVNWLKLSEELNDNGYTLNCTPDTLKSFFGIEESTILTKINWIKPHSSSYKRTPLFALIFSIDSSLLTDARGLLDNLNKHFVFGKEKKAESMDKLKAALSSSWNKKNKKEEVNKLSLKLKSITTLTK